MSCPSTIGAQGDVLALDVAVLVGEVIGHLEGDHAAVGGEALDRLDAQRVEDRPLRRRTVRRLADVVGQPPPGAVLRRRERPAEDGRDGGVAVEVRLLVAAPRTDVAVERHARVQVVHQVVVLVDEQRGQSTTRRPHAPGWRGTCPAAG